MLGIRMGEVAVLLYRAGAEEVLNGGYSLGWLIRRIGLVPDLRLVGQNGLHSLENEVDDGLQWY